MGYSMRTGVVAFDLEQLSNVTVAADGRTATVQVGEAQAPWSSMGISAALLLSASAICDQQC